MSDLKRANKLTVRFDGGDAVGTFYKTHDKITSVRSSDPLVVANGYVMETEIAKADGTKTEIPGAERLKSFRDWLIANATVFGVVYDAIDRRTDGNKFPNRYTIENIGSIASETLAESLNTVIGSLQDAIDKYAAAGQVPAGAVVSMDMGDPAVEVKETYSSGHLKYADVTIPVKMAVAAKSVDVNVKVELISGQLKKPRAFGQYSLTMTGLKATLVDAEILPKAAEKPAEDADKPKRTRKAAKGDDTAEVAESAPVDGAIEI